MPFVISVTQRALLVWWGMLRPTELKLSSTSELNPVSKTVLSLKVQVSFILSFMFVLFFPFIEALSERKWGGGGGWRGRGGGAAFICYWLVVFACFFLCGRVLDKKRLPIFLEGDRGFVLRVFLAIILSSFALFLHISLPNADAEIRGQSEHTLSSEGLLQKQLFVRVGRSRALSSVQILAK